MIFWANPIKFSCVMIRKLSVWYLACTQGISHLRGKGLGPMVCRSWGISPANQAINFLLTSPGQSSVNHSLILSDTARDWDRECSSGGTKDCLHGSIQVQGSDLASSAGLSWHPFMLCILRTAHQMSSMYVFCTACLLGQSMVPDMLWQRANFTLKAAKKNPQHPWTATEETAKVCRASFEEKLPLLQEHRSSL